MLKKNITNVTIKDAHYELDNCYFIATQMLKYGEVIPRSVCPGYKIHMLKNGSRYLQILNCIPTLPNRTKFTCVEVLVFADNTRTECIHCGQNTHPSYSCRQKLTFKKRCFNCTGHITRDCPYDPICSYCKNR